LRDRFHRLGIGPADLAMAMGGIVAYAVQVGGISGLLGGRAACFWLCRVWVVHLHRFGLGDGLPVGSGRLMMNTSLKLLGAAEVREWKATSHDK